jgi:circadian clock protein KaiB
MSRRTQFKFRLYVAEGTANSALALINLTALCEEFVAGRHEIEVVDVFREPKRALADSILMTPTLVRLAPPPMRRIVGTLAQRQPVMLALGFEVITS